MFLWHVQFATIALECRSCRGSSNVTSPNYMVCYHSGMCSLSVPHSTPPSYCLAMHACCKLEEHLFFAVLVLKKCLYEVIMNDKLYRFFRALIVRLKPGGEKHTGQPSQCALKSNDMYIFARTIVVVQASGD